MVISKPMDYNDIKQAQRMFGAQEVLEKQAEKSMVQQSQDINQTILN